MSYFVSYTTDVRQIGMRELNHHPSRVIDLVKKGETVEITERGRPVARVVPIVRPPGVLDTWVRGGRALAPSAERRPLPLPPRVGDPAHSAADDITAARERERW